MKLAPIFFVALASSAVAAEEPQQMVREKNAGCVFLLLYCDCFFSLVFARLFIGSCVLVKGAKAKARAALV